VGVGGGGGWAAAGGGWGGGGGEGRRFTAQPQRAKTEAAECRDGTLPPRPTRSVPRIAMEVGLVAWRQAPRARWHT